MKLSDAHHPGMQLVDTGPQRGAHDPLRRATFLWPGADALALVWLIWSDAIASEMLLIALGISSRGWFRKAPL